MPDTCSSFSADLTHLCELQSLLMQCNKSNHEFLQEIIFAISPMKFSQLTKEASMIYFL